MTTQSNFSNNTSQQRRQVNTYITNMGISLQSSSAQVSQSGKIAYNPLNVRRIDIVKQLIDTWYTLSDTILRTCATGELKQEFCNKLRIAMKKESTENLSEPNITRQQPQPAIPSTRFTQNIPIDDEIAKESRQISLQLKKVKLSTALAKEELTLRKLTAEITSLESKAHKDSSDAKVSQIKQMQTIHDYEEKIHDNLTKLQQKADSEDIYLSESETQRKHKLESQARALQSNKFNPLAIEEEEETEESTEIQIFTNTSQKKSKTVRGKKQQEEEIPELTPEQIQKNNEIRERIEEQNRIEQEQIKQKEDKRREAFQLYKSNRDRIQVLSKEISVARSSTMSKFRIPGLLTSKIQKLEEEKTQLELRNKYFDQEHQFTTQPAQRYTSSQCDSD